MKKLIIYKVYFSETLKMNVRITIRTITVSADFIGIDKYGNTIRSHFEDLAKDLEPKMSSFAVIDL